MIDEFIDGWKRYSGTWHYVSASSFKMSGDERSTFPVGSKIRFTQKDSDGNDVTSYAVVSKTTYDSTYKETTVTIVAGSATIANKNISNPCFTYELTPQGYPGFSSDFKVAKVALAAGAANAFAFAWQNPESSKIIVHKVIVNRTTAGGTATSVLDVGPANDATSTADTIIDGLNLNTTGVADNIADKGTNGTTRSVLLDANGGTTDYITGKILVEKADDLVGYVYIYYSII